MATATLTSQMTDLNLNPGSPTNLGTGNAQSSETAINLEGSNCSATGHAGSLGPTSPTAISQFRGAYATVTSTTRTDNHIHVWIRDLYPIRDVNVGGVSVYLFGSQAALYYVTGLDVGYAGGWFHAVINADAGDRPAASLGTAPTGNITRVGYCGNISVSKGEDFLQNCYFDAIRSATGGQGITLTGGTTGDRLLFSDLADADTSSYGLFRNIGGSFFVEGPVTIGSATSTTYLQETLQTINFSNLTVNNSTGGNTVVSAVASDYYSIELADGTTGVTNVDFTDVTWKGVSRATPFDFSAPLGAGDAFTSLRSTYVFADRIAYNTLTTSTNDTFIECRIIDPQGATLTNPTFSNCDDVDLTATFDIIAGGTTTLHNTAVNVAFVTTNDVEKITDHSFDNTSGTGHAIELTATGTYDLDNIGLTGYLGTPGSNLVASSGSNSAAIYNNSGGAITLNVINGGDTPSIRNAASSTTTVVAGAVTVQVTVVTSLGVPVENARVFLRPSDGTGPHYFEQSFTSLGVIFAVAYVNHTAHHLVDGDIIEMQGAADPLFNGVFTIHDVTVNQYRYTMASSPAGAAGGTPLVTEVELSGLTNASGVLSTSGVYATDQPVTGRARKSSTTPLYKTAPFNGTIDTADGFFGIGVLVLDE